MNRKTKKIAFNIVVLALVLSGIVWICSRFVHLGRVEYTDNAQIKQHIVPINSRVRGFVKQVRFEEYRHVDKGDTLVIIDDAEFRLRLAQAKADYANALAGRTAAEKTISATHNNLHVSDAGIEEMKTLLQNAEKDYRRYQTLFSQQAVTEQQFDAAKTSYESMKAKYDMLVRQKQSTALLKEEQAQRLNQTEAAVEMAEAALHLAELNLSYTVITAPHDGVTGRKNIQEGELIETGQTLLDLVDERDKWIVANYKETQTANIGVGMPVEISVDAVPGVLFHGRVQAISQATGASLSLLPQDNSAGNFIKVQQRIPVRIELTDDNPEQPTARLRAGMNVECKVKY